MPGPVRTSAVACDETCNEPEAVTDAAYLRGRSGRGVAAGEGAQGRGWPCPDALPPPSRPLPPPSVSVPSPSLRLTRSLLVPPQPPARAADVRGAPRPVRGALHDPLRLRRAGPRRRGQPSPRHRSALAACRARVSVRCSTWHGSAREKAPRMRGGSFHRAELAAAAAAASVCWPSCGRAAWMLAWRRRG